MYRFIPLHSYDYRKKIQSKQAWQLTQATDEGNSRNEIGHLTKDEIGVAVQSWLLVRVELMA